MRTRRYDIDWLRIILILLVFLFHCARFYGGGTWMLNHPTESLVAWVFIGWVDVWIMPLFFLLSGVGSWYALRSRSNQAYLKERFMRLLIPLFTVGLVFINLPQFFFYQWSNSGFRGTFGELLNQYFGQLGQFSMDVPNGLLPIPYPGHLWFLQFLFLISLLSLPLMRYGKTENGKKWLARLRVWGQSLVGVWWWLLPLLLVRISLRSFFLGWNSWAFLVEFLLFFLIGYCYGAIPQWQASFQRWRWVGLVTGIVCFAGTFYMVIIDGYQYNYELFSGQFLVYEVVFTLGRWAWIVFILGLAARHLQQPHSWLSYGNEAVLPFYILHQPIIGCVGWFVIFRGWPIFVQYLVIATGSLILTGLIYVLLIRPWNAMRFLFGMRKKTPPQASSNSGKLFRPKMKAMASGSVRQKVCPS